MTSATDDALRLAEDAHAYTPLWPSTEREARAEFVLRHGRLNPHHLFGLVLRVRGGDADRVVDEVREWFRARGRRDFTWLVGDSATPPDLRERLIQRGATPDSDEPVYAGMTLTEPPPPVAGILARPVETFDEYALSRELGWDVVGMPEEARAAARTQLEAMWTEYQDIDITSFVAFVDDRLVATGGVQFTRYGAYLAGGSTHPDFRGRGCYRALVRARWDAAVARGTPLLAVQAGKMSKPILERIGFRQIATVHALVDRT